MKKTTVIKKITAAGLAVTAILLSTCMNAFAIEEKTGGADLVVGNQTTHYDNVSEAWAKACSTEENAKVVLQEDWIADENNSFGKGEGFGKGAINVLYERNRITLDLNGYKIDRGLESAKEDGHVFYVQSSNDFTITDSSEAKTGLITGGYSKDKGGAINVYGSNITIENVKIAKNATEKRGGAIFAEKLSVENYVDKVKLVIKNCEITENEANKGGAIYIGTSNELKIYDTTITGNKAKYDAGIHTEVCGIYKTKVTLGGKVIIADNECEVDGKGLMLDEGFFTKVCISFDKNNPLSDESEIVILSKTNDKTLRITNDSSDNHIGCFKYENGKYKIVAKGSGSSQYLDIKKN